MEKLEKYILFLEDLKQTILSIRQKAIWAANAQMMRLYWTIGKKILVQQADLGWGAKVIDTLATDLKMLFPDMKGLSPRNLKYMRAFAEAYPDETFVQASLAQISWYHHITLLDKVKDDKIRHWYIEHSYQNGWSRNMMVHKIEAKLHEKTNILPNNFEHTLPNYQSDLAQQIFKDEYIFDFIALDEMRYERELEKDLVGNIMAFLLELGKGFAFVGKQYRLTVEGQEFYVDLLFYHIKLKCFVVVELKIDEFKPEYVGKLNFYLSAVDDLLKSDSDNPTIGLLLCKTKKRFVVEYSLRNYQKPIGVASYYPTEAKLKEALPSENDLQDLVAKITNLKN
jgi:predicted nuclease of restriction endonuclease-like (RecB) superfamily